MKYGICLSVEISSAQVCWPEQPTMEIALVHSLYGDGCAAALIRSHEPQDIALDNKFGICPILEWESYVVPDSLHLMIKQSIVDSYLYQHVNFHMQLVLIYQ